MKLQSLPRPAYGSTTAPGHRTLFVVSRDLPTRYNSLAYSFDGDHDVRVIFDRRRTERRRQTSTGGPAIERRRRDRRSGAREWTLHSAGWVEITPV